MNWCKLRQHRGDSGAKNVLLGVGHPKECRVASDDS